MSIFAEMQARALGSPVGPRSHFLPITPIITLGEEFEAEKVLSPHAMYVAFHEFLHYEQFVSTPFTIFQYARRMMRLIGILGRHKGVEVDVSSYESVLAVLELPYASSGWDDSKVAALQPNTFRIGLSALFEGNAILDCFCKPPENWFHKEGTRVIEALFRERNLQANREHIIGTESCLAAVGAPNVDLGSNKNPEILSLAASLPLLVFMFALGQAFKECGFTGGTYDDVHRCAGENLPELLRRYRTRTDRLLREVFTERAGPEFLSEAGVVRETFICGTHAIASLFAGVAAESYPKTAPALPLLGPQWPFGNILRAFEMRNIYTLTRCGAPLRFPRYSAVPAMLFNARSMSSLWVEFPRKSETVFKWSVAEQMTHSQYLGWLSWCVSAILEEIGDAVEHQSETVSCPFFKWVRDRYAERGIFEDNVVYEHLHQMCNGPFSVTIDREPIREEVRPSAEYCTCPLGEKPKRIACLFRSVVDRFERPRATVYENQSSERLMF